MAFRVVTQRRYNNEHLQFVFGVTDAARYNDAMDEITEYVVNTCNSSMQNVDTLSMTRLRDLQDGRAYGTCTGYQVSMFFALPST